MDLIKPVPNKRGRTHDKVLLGSSAKFMCVTGKHTDGLKGLAQAHIVRQDPAESEITEKVQPADAILLIHAQIGLNWNRNGIGLDVRAVQKLVDKMSFFQVYIGLRTKAVGRSRWGLSQRIRVIHKPAGTHAGRLSAYL